MYDTIARRFSSCMLSEEHQENQLPPEDEHMVAHIFSTPALSNYSTLLELYCNAHITYEIL